MQAMKGPGGAAKMSRKAQKILEMLVEHLAWSARATAWREGQDWEPERRPRRDEASRDHQAN
jgi:hypothetical protein